MILPIKFDPDFSIILRNSPMNASSNVKCDRNLSGPDRSRANSPTT